MTCASTSLRMSVMARCAATPRICELANDVTVSTIVAAAVIIASFGSRSQCPWLMTLSMRYLVVAGRTSPARRFDDHDRQADAQADAVLPDERARFFPGAGAQLLLGRRRALSRAVVDRGRRSGWATNGSYLNRVQHGHEVREVREVRRVLRGPANAGGSRCRLGDGADAARKATPERVAEAAMLKADRDFNQAVADRDMNRFLSFVAEDATFNAESRAGRGGEGVGAVLRSRTARGCRGRRRRPNRSSPATSATRSAPGNAGRKAPDGAVKVTHGQYLTVWQKQKDGSWQATFDTGSTAPSGTSAVARSRQSRGSAVSSRVSVGVLRARFLELVAMVRMSRSGETTRANGPKLRIQLSSARSRQTSSVIATPPLSRLAQLLRRMPRARAHVVGRRRLKFDLDALRRARVHAQRVRKRLVRQLLDRRERLLEQRQFRNAVDRERPHLGVLGHVREQVQRALGVGQPVRVHEVGLGAIARLRVVGDLRLALMERRLERARLDARPPRAVGDGLRLRLGRRARAAAGRGTAACAASAPPSACRRRGPRRRGTACPRAIRRASG